MSAAQDITIPRRKIIGPPPSDGFNVRWVSDLASSGQEMDLADAKQAFLRLRSGPKKTSYYVQWVRAKKKHRLTLGLVPELTLADARRLTRKALDLIEQGLIPDDDWLRSERNPVAPVLTIVRDTWTYEQAVKSYLAEVKKTRKEATFHDYRKVLNHDCLQQLMPVAVRDITEEQVSSILADYQEKQEGVAAAKLRRTMSPFWGYLVRADIRLKSGVARRLKIDLPPMTTALPKQLRFPHPHEVADLYKAATDGLLGWSSDAIAWLCLTVQRREAVVTIQYKHLKEDVWNIPPIHRKTAKKRQDNRNHVIPLPFMQPKMSNFDPEHWVFPAKRPRKKGGKVSHVSGSTLTHALLDFGAAFSPHDVRRSFGTTMMIEGFSEADVKLVLDHNEKKVVNTADIHYIHFRRMVVKRKMMKMWWSLIMGERKLADGLWEEATGIKAIVADIVRD